LQQSYICGNKDRLQAEGYRVLAHFAKKQKAVSSLFNDFQTALVISTAFKKMSLAFGIPAPNIRTAVGADWQT
jgi:hypothetical protein